MNVCTCRKKPPSSRLRTEHTSFPCNFTPYWGAILPTLSICAIDSSTNFLFLPLLFLVSSSTFPTFHFHLFLHCLDMCEFNSSIPAACHCCFSQSPSQFLCTPYAELVVRGDAKLRGSSGEAIEFAAIALEDQTCMMDVLNTHRC